MGKVLAEVKPTGIVHRPYAWDRPIPLQTDNCRPHIISDKTLVVGYSSLQVSSNYLSPEKWNQTDSVKSKLVWSARNLPEPGIST